MVKTGNGNTDKFVDVIKMVSTEYLDKYCSEQGFAAKNFKKYKKIYNNFCVDNISNIFLYRYLNGNNVDSKCGYFTEIATRKLMEETGTYTVLHEETEKKVRTIAFETKIEVDRIIESVYAGNSKCLSDPERLKETMKKLFNIIQKNKFSTDLYSWSTQVDMVCTNNETNKLTLMEIKSSDCFNCGTMEDILRRLLYCYAYYVLSLDIKEPDDIEFVVAIATQGNQKFKNVLSYNSGLLTFDAFCSEYLGITDSSILWNAIEKGRAAICEKHDSVVNKIILLLRNRVYVEDNVEFFKSLGILSKREEQKMITAAKKAVKLKEKENNRLLKEKMKALKILESAPKTYTRVKGYKCLENCEITAK